MVNVWGKEEVRGRRDTLSPEGGDSESTLDPTVLTGLCLETDPLRGNSNRQIREVEPTAPGLPGWVCNLVYSLAEELKPPAFPGPWCLNNGHCNEQTKTDSLVSWIQEGSGVFTGDPREPW